MAKRVYANNVSTRLTAQLLSGGTTANVTAGDGALFAGANGSDWIIATLRKMSGYKDVAREIVKVTNRATDALTIVRAQEGTAALQFEVGDTLDIDFTAAAFDSIPQYADAITPTGTINGTNLVFTLPNAPSPAASLQLFINGILQRAGGIDFTLSGSTITFASTAATPQTGQNLLAYYRL
jgi:hypothetical protein